MQAARADVAALRCKRAELAEKQATMPRKRKRGEVVMIDVEAGGGTARSSADVIKTEAKKDLHLRKGGGGLSYSQVVSLGVWDLRSLRIWEVWRLGIYAFWKFGNEGCVWLGSLRFWSCRNL